MRLYLDRDEWYPVYTLDRRRRRVMVKLSEAEYLEYQRIVAEFKALQSKLSALDT